MKNYNKNNIYTRSKFDDYMTTLASNHKRLMIHGKKMKPKKGENIEHICLGDYNNLLKYNYNANQLKSIAKTYGLQISGNKETLTTRIFMHLYLSTFTIKIQKIVRGGIQRVYNNLHGPAYKNRSLCTNDSDFVTMDPLNELPFNRFISYKDNDNFIYGFDIVSLYNLKYKFETSYPVKNPYNRNMIPNIVIKNMKQIIRINKNIFNTAISFSDDEMSNISSTKTIELRVLELFQNIDSLGNYSNPDWFLSLNINQLLRFIRELIDIFNYRSQLTPETRISICPPHGNPFSQLYLETLVQTEDIDYIRVSLITVMEKLVNTGTSNDYKYLGACYILAALTIVSESAAQSIPWLYESVSVMF